jgi:hypothetical protein
MTFPSTHSSPSSSSVFHVSHFSFPQTSASSTSVFQDCHDRPSPPFLLQDLIRLLMCSTVSHLPTPCYHLHKHQVFGLWKSQSKLKPSHPFVIYNRNHQICEFLLKGSLNIVKLLALTFIGIAILLVYFTCKQAFETNTLPWTTASVCPHLFIGSIQSHIVWNLALLPVLYRRTSIPNASVFRNVERQSAGISPCFLGRYNFIM